MGKINLCGLSAEEIFDIIKPGGYGLRDAVTVANLLYKKCTEDFMKTDKLPRGLRYFLKENTNALILKPIARQISVDGSVKYLFRNETGQQFETVFIPEGKRYTVCVSTQSGCRMGCQFCMTSKYGFHGNLIAGNIVSQVIGIPEAAKVNHIVFMGMGEPLDNYENVYKASEIFISEWGLALSPRNITVSTVGIIPEIRRFLDQSTCNLTFSLFSPFPDERIKVIPLESRNPAAEIIQIMKKYPLKKKRRFSIAYVMIAGFNDSDSHLNGLIALLKGTGIRVNLLPYHSAGDEKAQSSDEEKMLSFKHRLVISGISASVRKSRGVDISAACGLLASGLISS